MRYALVDADDVVVNVIELEPGADYSPPDGCTLVEGRDWPQPAPGEPPLAMVPAITKRQALLFLLSIGKTEDDVEAAIAAIADPMARAAARIEWRYPPGFLHHTHPLFAALAPAIGIGVDDLPDAFRAAAAL